MADVNVEKLKEKLYEVASALFHISETCVDVSKQHISAEKAFEKIRGYLNDAGMWSRVKVDQIIEDCMEPIISNVFEEPDNEWLNKLLKERPIQTLDINFPACCDGCSNNPKNGGSGICNCTIPYMQNPIQYTSASTDSCMVNNVDGYVYTINTDIPTSVMTEDKISEAVERTKQYERR